LPMTKGTFARFRDRAGTKKPAHGGLGKAYQNWRADGSIIRVTTH